MTTGGNESVVETAAASLAACREADLEVSVVLEPSVSNISKIKIKTIEKRKTLKIQFCGKHE